MRKWSINLLIFQCVCLTAFGQNIPIDSWRTHFSYRNARILESSNDKLFCAVQNGLFSLDLEDGSLNKISKIDGLSGAGISSLKYNRQSEVLAIGYQSGLIDLIFENEVANIRDFNELRESFDKVIFDVEIHNGFVYAATNIGIIVVSLTNKTILDNFRSIGDNAAELSVFELAQFENNLFAITSEGIQYGSLSENLLDFNRWNRIAQPQNSFRELTPINDKLYLVKNDSLLCIIENDLITEVANLGKRIEKVRAHDGKVGLLASNQLTTWEATNGLQIVFSFSQINNATDFISNDRLWFADGKVGLTDSDETALIPNGPISDNITNIELVDGKLYAFYGPAPEEFSGAYDSLGYNVFDGISWTYNEIQNFYNIVGVANYRNNMYFSSVGAGIFDSNNQIILNSNNSAFNQNRSNTGVSISDMSVGRSLWVTSYDNQLPLMELNRDGEWMSYPISTLGSAIPTAIDVSSGETLWVQRQFNNPVMLNIDDNSRREINSSSGLANGSVTDIEIDNEDHAWVATTLGLTNYAEASIINDNIIGSSLSFGGEVIYNDVAVTSIASDGGARVWIADRDRLSVFSNNFLDRFFVFTERNSPIVSTSIIKMEYNSENGELYILTNRGLISYRSNSSRQNNRHQSVAIFPNPVRPGYSGQVGIKGVVTDADIKITDINGKLIQNVRAFGGTASWDLQDYNGRRVQAGIYLIFSSNEDGEETFIDKIAILR